MSADTRIKTVIRVKVSASKRGEAVEILRSILQPTRTELGCVSSRLFQDLEDERWVGVMESWRTRDDLVRHLRTERFRRVLAALELSDCPPEIEFDTVLGSDGLELVHAARAPEME